MGSRARWRLELGHAPDVVDVGGLGLGMMVMMLVFWGVVITGIVLAIRWLAGQGEKSRSHRAFDILRERYARAEINKDEFEAKQRDLR